MIAVTLPWPSPKLSPNARVHWRPLAEAKKSARLTAKALTMNAVASAPVEVWHHPLPMRWTFCPPTKRRYDRDNLIAQMKASQDGISDAIGIDDFHFSPTYRFGDVIKNGAVIVEIGNYTAQKTTEMT